MEHNRRKSTSLQEQIDFVEKMTKDAIKFQVNIDNGESVPALQVRTIHTIEETLPSSDTQENIGKMLSVAILQPSMSGVGQLLFVDRSAIKKLIEVLTKISNEYL